MTKAQLMEMLKDMEDNDAVRFITTGYDREGWIEEYAVQIIRVEKK